MTYLSYNAKKNNKKLLKRTTKSTYRPMYIADVEGLGEHSQEISQSILTEEPQRKSQYHKHTYKIISI